MTTMYESAVAWVEHHRANCTSKTCGCHEADEDLMVAELVARWLTDEH